MRCHFDDPEVLSASISLGPREIVEGNAAERFLQRVKGTSATQRKLEWQEPHRIAEEPTYTAWSKIFVVVAELTGLQRLRFEVASSMFVLIGT